MSGAFSTPWVAARSARHVALRRRSALAGARIHNEITQSPSKQWFLPWQTLPQPPQFASSLFVSTHAPEQRENPELQVVPHTPAAHTGVPFATAGQALPQPPQLFTSVFASTHWEPQRVREPLHAKSQPLGLQTGIAFGGELHTVPHSPQLEVSLVTSTHEPEHGVRLPQSVEQMPDLQTVPVSHTFVQLPQCCPLVEMSTHLPPQSM